MLGDYVLQLDFIAKTKGNNWYHLFVHCFLYVLPFYMCYGFSWKILILLVSHLIIDALKARYNKINYLTDQILHYSIAMMFLKF